MAAGRYGGFRDNDFRDRESNFEFSMQDFVTAKEDYQRIRNSKSEVEKGRARERVRIRHRDVKEKESVNGGYRSSSSSSRSDSGSSGGKGDKLGPKRCEFSVKAVDREPGELSSESGSDDAMESESRVKDTEDSKKLIENGSKTLAERKRKFSPIIWDRDVDNGGSKSSKSRTTKAVTALPPPPPLPKSYRQSLIQDGNVQISPISKNQSEDLQSLPPAERPFETNKDAATESPPVLSFASPKQQQDNDQEVAELEGEDYVPTRNISLSRWADGNNSPADEGEILEEEDIPKKRRKISPGSAENSVRNKSLTPEPGELRKYVSESTRGRSSESDERRTHSRSSSGDDYPDIDSDEDDYMQVDVEDDRMNNTRSQSDTNSEDEDDYRKTPEPLAPPPRSVNMLQGCRSVDEFERLNKIDEGTYGVVYRARDKKTGEIVALKKVKMEKEREGFPLTSLREINILLSFHHPSIVDVKEVVVGSSLDSIFMAMEYMEHDLKALMETMKQPFSQSEVKCLMLQLLEGIKYLHDNWVLHRDLKTSNLLLNNRGELKICDFGLARQYGSPLKPYTHLVVTLWYRAPELLLGAKQYSTAIDMWSLGCIMAELLSKDPLFNGKTEFEQLDKIFRTLGTPNETIWPGFSKLPGVKVNFVKHQYNLLRKKFPATSFTGSPVLSDAGFDLLNRLLTYDPEKRITAEAAINHEWFREVPLPKSKEFMPTFPAQHAQDRRMRRMMKSPDPLEEQRIRELQKGELGTGGVFG